MHVQHKKLKSIRVSFRCCVEERRSCISWKNWTEKLKSTSCNQFPRNTTLKVNFPASIMHTVKPKKMSIVLHWSGEVGVSSFLSRIDTFTMRCIESSSLSLTSMQKWSVLTFQSTCIVLSPTSTDEWWWFFLLLFASLSFAQCANVWQTRQHVYYSLSNLHN